MSLITQDTLVSEVLDACPDAAPVFLSMGMHCLGCPMSRRESVAQAAASHGADADEIVRQINALIAGCEA